MFVCTGTYGTKKAPDHTNGIRVVRRTQGNTTALVDLATGCRDPDLDGTRDQRRANLKCSAALLEGEIIRTHRMSVQYAGRPENSLEYVTRTGDPRAQQKAQPAV